jgi:hypothetical protein
LAQDAAVSLRTVLSEPLVQFAIGGALLFSAHAMLRPATEVVVVHVPDAADAEAERARVDEALLVAEARARGLDLDDVIVRRRLAQKMRFVLEGDLAPTAVDDRSLEALRDADPEAYRTAPRRGFEHVFVDPARHPDAAARAEQWRDELAAGAPARRGDPFAYGRRAGLATASAHAGRFGEAFAEAVMAADPDRWFVAQSSFGWHVVRVDESREGELPAVESLRARLLADLEARRRAEHLAAAQAELRGRYAVEIVRGED